MNFQEKDVDKLLKQIISEEDLLIVGQILYSQRGKLLYCNASELFPNATFLLMLYAICNKPDLSLLASILP